MSAYCPEGDPEFMPRTVDIAPATESNVSTLNRIRQAVAQIPTYETDEIADILEDIESVISSLEGIARAER